MSYFMRLASVGSLVWECSRATNPPESISYTMMQGVGIDNENLKSSISTSGRFFFVRIASMSPNDPEITGWNSQGTYVICCQRYLYTKCMLLRNVNDTAGLDFIVPSSAYNPNALIPAEMRFVILKSQTEDKYTFISLNPALTLTCLTAASANAGAGFRVADVTTDDSYRAFSPIGYGATTLEAAGSGPVLISLPGEVYPYYISALGYQGTPLPNEEFAWTQLKRASAGSSGGALEPGFDMTDAKTWVFEKVKSKLNTPADSIYTYKIRSLGSTANPAGYLTCIASGITGDEFELIPHGGIFGTFSIRSVAHGTTLKRFLKAIIGGTANFALVTGNPSATDYAFQFRPFA